MAIDSEANEVHAHKISRKSNKRGAPRLRDYRFTQGVSSTCHGVSYIFFYLHRKIHQPTTSNNCLLLPSYGRRPQKTSDTQGTNTTVWFQEISILPHGRLLEILKGSGSLKPNWGFKLKKSSVGRTQLLSFY